MNQIQPFQYDEHEVRVVDIDGEPWFVLADLCKALGLSNPSVYATRLAQIGEVTRFYPTVDRLGRTQQAVIVSEPGMYEVVIRSDKPDAVAFRRWITGDVIPTIRKTGGYGQQPALQGPELIAAALIESQKVIEQREARIHQLERKADEDAPKVGYVDTYVTDADLLTFSTVASTLNIQEKALRQLLIEKDWIYVQTDSRWSNTHGKKIERRRYSEKASKKRHFRRVECHEAPRFRGSEVMHTLKVTPAGAEAIARIVAKESAA